MTAHLDVRPHVRASVLAELVSGVGPSSTTAIAGIACSFRATWSQNANKLTDYV